MQSWVSSTVKVRVKALRVSVRAGVKYNTKGQNLLQGLGLKLGPMTFFNYQVSGN